MVLSALLLAPLLLLAPPAAASEEPPANGEPLPAILARVDTAWTVRDEPGGLARAQEALAEASRLAPTDYDVLWRQARELFWRADDLHIAKEEKSRLGKEAWAAGDRASAARPDAVEGWFYSASGVGNYALGIGVLTALGQGIEGKFKERLARAEAIDPGYQSGAIQTAWGRFWYELPWPKYDAARSERALRAALQTNPRNVRALVYLAELLAKENRATAARAVLEEAAALTPGAYDGPEERRWQERARELIAARKR